MKKHYYLLLTILITSLSFGQIASDDFTYSDGSLVGNGSWVSHSGNAGDLLVSSGQVVVQHGTPSEDAHLPFTPVSGVLYFGIDFSVSSSSDIPGSDNEYFAHFKDSGNGFRARLDVVPGTGGGNYTVGISSSGSTADVVWGTDLTFGVTYRAIAKYDQDSGVAELWIDASSSGDTSITGDTPSSGTSIESFALRQSDSNNNETITVDNLIVGQTFAEVSGASTSTQVTIGTGTAEGEELPIEPYYGYSYSQVIYTAAEIGVSGTINSVTYSANANTTLTNSGDWVVYMGTTSASSFASNSDWVAGGNMTQVFDGVVTPDGSGNVLVTLDTAFNYVQGDNLVIAVDQNTAGYDSSNHDFYCTAASETRGLTHYSDGTNADPATWTSGGYTRDYIANIVLDITESADVSADWSVSVSGADATVSITVNNFTVGAAGGGDDGHWHYTLDGGSEVMVYDTNDVVLTGLANGDHTLVAWLTDDNHQALSPAVEETITFSTFNGNYEGSYPYCSSFDADLDNWTAEAVSGDANWSSASANQNSSVTPLTGAGMAYMYDNSSVANLISPSMDLSAVSNPQVTFNHTQVEWAGDQDELRVWYKAASGDAWTELAAYTTEVATWTEVTLDLPNPSATYYIAFNGTAGYGRGMTIDDVCVDAAPVTYESIPWSDDFETNDFSAGWTSSEAAGAPTSIWEVSSLANNTSGGAYSARHNYSSSGTYDSYLVGPTFDLSGASNPVVSYSDYVNWTGDADVHSLVYSEDYVDDVDAATWVVLNDVLGSEDTWVANGPYALPTTGTVTIAFRYQGYYAAEWFVDDVTVEEEPVSNTVLADPTLGWLGYMNVFDLTAGAQGGYLWGSAWGVPDVATTLNTDTDYMTITLEPNYNGYADNPGDAYWQDGSVGAKWMEGSTYVESATDWNGGELTFTGYVYHHSLATDWTANFFIKALDPNAGYSDALNGAYITALPTDGQFSVTVSAGELAAGYIVQAGFSVNGPNANPDNQAANGKVILGGDVDAPMSIDDVDVLDMRIYPNPVDGNFVTILSPINGTKYIQVFDINGRRVMDTSINNNTLDVSSINSGFYMIKVTINGQSKISKLVVR